MTAVVSDAIAVDTTDCGGWRHMTRYRAHHNVAPHDTAAHSDALTTSAHHERVGWGRVAAAEHHARRLTHAATHYGVVPVKPHTPGARLKAGRLAHCRAVAAAAARVCVLCAAGGK